MCLICKDNKPEIAKEDILCYKMIVKEEQDWYTPFMHYPIPNPPCVLEIKEEPMIEEESNSDGDIYFYVGVGFIHSYGKLYSGLYNNFDRKGIALFAAVIPKGTLYYRGIDGDYASRELKIETEVCNSDDYNEDTMMFCEVEGKTYTVGDIKNLIRQCVVFKNWDFISGTYWTVGLPRGLMDDLEACGYLNDSTIKMNYKGFFVTHRIFPKLTDGCYTHVVFLSCVEKLIKGERVTFGCLRDETTD